MQFYNVTNNPTKIFKIIEPDFQKISELVKSTKTILMTHTASDKKSNHAHLCKNIAALDMQVVTEWLPQFRRCTP